MTHDTTQENRDGSDRRHDHRIRRAGHSGPSDCRSGAAPGTWRARSPRSAGDRRAGCRGDRRARAAARRTTAGTGDLQPQVRVRTIRRPVGIPAGCLAPGQGPVQLRRNAGRPDAGRRPTAARCRSGAPAAARIQIAERPGVRSPGNGPGRRGAGRRCPRATTRSPGRRRPGTSTRRRPAPNTPPGMAPIPVAPPPTP